MNSETHRLVGSYYLGANGPSILLFISSVESAQWLRELLRSQSEGSHLNLFANPEVSIEGIAGLELETRTEGPEAELKKKTVSNGIFFTLSCRPTGWEELALLIEPFCNGKTGHQYFPDGVGNDAVIEFSFGELTDEQWHLLFES